jgi:regulator of cell morphogenesis and NO signaling
MSATHSLHSTPSTNDLATLIDAVPNFHHRVLRQKLASVYRAIQRIARNHVVPLGVMDQLERRFLAVADELETNLEEQECWLFAWLRRLVNRGPLTGQPSYLGENLVEVMYQAATANQETLHGIGQIQACLSHPDWIDRGPLVDELIDHLRILDQGMTEYELLEREELFPRVHELCQSWNNEGEVSHAS